MVTIDLDKLQAGRRENAYKPVQILEDKDSCRKAMKTNNNKIIKSGNSIKKEMCFPYFGAFFL